jgi:hypothetical protein
MYQHERVCEGDIDKSLDPVRLPYLPYFHSDSSQISLIDTDKIKNFLTSPVPIVKKVPSNIKLGAGFRVCVLSDTNHVFIVGGEGSETKTFIFNSENNMIEPTEWDLKYPRQNHSLCSANNIIICTGSSVGSDSDDFENCNKVEVFR